MSRDRALEHAFLTAAQHRASGRGDYPARVQARLEQAERTYGADSFRTRTPTELADEIREEALDIGGWAVLLLQVLDDTDTPPARLARARDQLERIVSIAVLLDGLVDRVRIDTSAPATLPAERPAGLIGTST